MRQLVFGFSLTQALAQGLDQAIYINFLWSQMSQRWGGEAEVRITTRCTLLFLDYAAQTLICGSPSDDWVGEAEYFAPDYLFTGQFGVSSVGGWLGFFVRAHNRLL